MKLTKGQAKFFKAVCDRAGGIFHKRVVEPIEGLPFGRPGGLVRWTEGTRLVGCNSFSADRFRLTEEGERLRAALTSTDGATR